MKITEDQIKKLCPTGKHSIISRFVVHFNNYAEKYDIYTPLRIYHFIAQAAHECAHFKTLEEYASGKAYEGREDLGNINPGDGVRYKGRGIFQLTGRDNYRRFGGILLERNPDLAANPRISVIIAMEYWRNKDLNRFADLDDIKGITYRINGGFNGIDDRIRLYNKIKEILV
jgi:putative chitinase